MSFSGIDISYAIESNGTEQRYPALQATSYKPRTLNEEIDLCLSEASYELLDAGENKLKTEIVECVYGREPVLMHKLLPPLRWVFLTIPKIFILDKGTKEVSLPQKGVKLYGTNKVTIAKCFLACLAGKDLILDVEGRPQIITLKLTSSKTNLVGYRSQTDAKTVISLNRELQKHFKLKSNLVHLVSVELAAKSKEFASSQSNESSLGVNFELIGNAKELSKQQQKQIFDLITDEEIKAMFDDPFGLNSQNIKEYPSPSYELQNDEVLDDICF